MAFTKKPLRPLRFADGLCYITLTQGLEAIIDEADAPLISERNWYARRSGKNFYACANGANNRMVHFHRVIMGAEVGQEIDHRNGDGLDNRRNNLRFATSSQNACNRRRKETNSTGFKGVQARKGKWVSVIQVSGKRQFLGYFTEPEAAYRAYLAASQRLHGEFGRAE